MHYFPLLSVCITLAVSGQLFAQTSQTGPGHLIPPSQIQELPAAVGSHGGSLKAVSDLQIETLVDQSGIQLYVFDRQGSSVVVNRGRGVAILRIEGNAKRYRYDLLPDGKGGLFAPVNLSQVEGRQLEIDVQLVGIGSADSGTKAVRFKEVTTVPADEAQLAAAAIMRQKTCPVSGEPLGSMGQPVGVDIQGQKVYVCCAGCVRAVQENPAKYALGRAEIAVSMATAADAPAIAQQKVCPVIDEPLGSMGTPVKVSIGDQPIYLCCRGCIKKVKAEPTKYLAKVYGNRASKGVPAGNEQVREGIYKVTAADALYIAAQQKCPVMDEPLDAMGGPYKVHANGRAVYICCPGCAKRIAAEPEKYLAVLKNMGIEAPAIR